MFGAGVVNSLGWGLVIVIYTALCALWSGLLTSEDEPPARSSSETHQRWEKRRARMKRRIWIWQAGLALIMAGWWFTTYQL